MNEVFGITGWKNSGKTTMVESLVAEFTKRGFTVSTVKNASEDFDVDHPGTDSFRHRHAGARETAIVSPKRWALMSNTPETGQAPSLDALLKKLGPCDLVLVEGFKNSNIPKIECVIAENVREQPIWKSNPSIVAVATDQPDEECPLPGFDINKVSRIADYIAQHAGLGL